MANRLSKVPTAVYVAEVTPIPDRPAFCVVQTIRTGYASAGSSSGSGGSNTTPIYAPSNPADGNYGSALTGGSWVNVPNSFLNGGNASGYSSNGSVGSSRGSALAPNTRTITTCYPAIPGRVGRPARTDYQANTGWNSGARSRKEVPTFGEFSATLLPTIVATQFGLARRSFDHTYSSMTHSLVARQGEWTVVEAGITKASGSLPSGARVAVRREGAQVSYYANGNLLYVSQVPLAGDVFGAAMMYSLADGVDSPSIVALAQQIGFAGRTPKWRMLAADGPVAGVSSDIPMPTLAAQLRAVHGVSQFSAVGPRFAMLATDSPLAVVAGRTPAPRMRASLSRAERTPNQLLAILPPPIVSMNLRSGGVLTVRGRTPRMAVVAADRPIAFVASTLPIQAFVYAGAPYMPPGSIDGMDNVIAADGNILDAALVLLTMDSVEVSGSASLTVVIELSTVESLRVADASSFGQLVEMLAMDSVSVYSSTSTARLQAIQYAVNALSGAPTTYEGFDFLAFATVRGETYGVMPDGLYRIGEGTDNGELIRALVDFGTSDFGDAHVKRMETAYLGVRTDGECYLRVRADAAQEKVYRVRGGNNVRKSNLAKGVAARSWSLQLELVDVSFAEVDSLELLVGATQRRGFGTRTR